MLHQIQDREENLPGLICWSGAEFPVGGANEYRIRFRFRNILVHHQISCSCDRLANKNGGNHHHHTPTIQHNEDSEIYFRFGLFFHLIIGTITFSNRNLREVRRIL